jgi:transcriptional regulator with XRE-family HTH domain
MGVSPSSSVQRARQELADRLRDLRLDAGLTARALSAEAGWHEAKTSRIESAKQAPTESDIQVWCRVCHAPRQAVDLIAASRAADSAYIEWRRMNRTGMRHLQENKRPLYARTTSFKVYCSTLVPGLVQTPGYARALLLSIIAFREIPNDVEDAVAARISRNRVLNSPGKRFVLLIEEAVLRCGIGDAETMQAQLGHLMTVTALSNVRLGIIPMTALQRPMWTVESFNVFDDATVHVELLSAQVTVTVPGEVVVYLRAFDQLARLAVYGADARSLIAKAISDLSNP